MLWLADENGSVTHKSHAWSLLTGQTPDEALGEGKPNPGGTAGDDRGPAGEPHPAALLGDVL